MITNIALKGIASYKEEQTLSELSPLNFIYGENGCGKSTIARFLDCTFNGAAEAEKFSECGYRVGWGEHEERKVLVYDAEFVKKLLSEPTLDGVFVMGEDAPELEKERLEKNKELDRNNKNYNYLQGQYIEFEEKIDAIDSSFTELCWTKGKSYRDEFKKAYAGYLKRESFGKKCLEWFEADGEVQKYEELQRLAKFYFSDKGQPLEKKQIPAFKWDDLTVLFDSTAFETEIKGKEDTTVSEFIALVGNNDWVARGRTFFDGKTCPFCQQRTPPSLAVDLETYFDENYSKQKEELATSIDQYTETTKSLMFRIQQLGNYNDGIFSYSQVESLEVKIGTHLVSNFNLLESKRNAPSESVTLITSEIQDLLKQVAEVVAQANVRIDEHNLTVQNFGKDKEMLKIAIWRYVSRMLHIDYVDFLKNRRGAQKGLSGVKKGMEAKLKEIKRLNEEVTAIGEKLKNIAKPAKDINSLLKSFGFSNFYLREEGEDARYSIIRDGGESANKTLSEGERTFIAFLYFYEMVKGMNPENNIYEDKIVVFDDPVSSLDSKVLYAVSALVKELSANRNLYKIHQVLLLTHNVYFFKEVTNMQDPEKNISKYWIIRKASGTSYLEMRETNPIRTSYQMLWDEVRMAAEYPDLDIRNTLRRIIEHYFEMLGGGKKWDLLNSFEGDDKFVCQSLFQWTNDGSHSIFDDIFISQDSMVKENYLRVFKSIFDESGHAAHYALMTGAEQLK
ncbi:MAG: AAA family ATPase [Halodesulfovibrio sp.]|uniref:AAA family ATPase n=1 Tax=Halodesulfovibrio sp. TaxID=1912772 RepID=UPI00359EE9CE